MLKSILRKVSNKLRKTIFIFVSAWKICISRRAKMIYLFGSPIHSNLGDQAQTYCLEKWFLRNYPEYGIYVFRLPESHKSLIWVLRKTIRKQDKIVFHSGYHLTDLYHEQDVYCYVAEHFKDHAIWIFPQTIHYKEESNLKRTAAILNQHGQVTLMVRDDESFVTAKRFFTGCHLLLYPDIVTSLIGTKRYQYKRDGILFCFRNDIEAYYSNEQISQLKANFNDVKTESTDTTLPLPGRYIINNREKVLNETLEYYSRFNLVITDRYHGTIFSLIAGTPVIVLKTTDHKLSSGVRWFPESFKDYVCYAQSLDEAYAMALKILSSSYSHQLPAYFKTNYYNKLKEILEIGKNADL